MAKHPFEASSLAGKTFAELSKEGERLLDEEVRAKSDEAAKQLVYLNFNVGVLIGRLEATAKHLYILAFINCLLLGALLWREW